MVCLVPEMDTDADADAARRYVRWHGGAERWGMGVQMNKLCILQSGSVL